MTEPTGPLTAEDLCMAIPGHGMVRWGDATPEQREAWEKRLQEVRNNTRVGQQLPIGG
jgi:hypothetical protein